MSSSEGSVKDNGEEHDLAAIIEEISHYLPSQGPIKTFVHHNTLHHFENLEFFEAIDTAAKIYGAATALPEPVYQSFWEQKRITYADMNRVLDACGLSSSPWIFGVSKRKIARSLMLSAPIPLTAETLRWRLVEKRYLARFHDEVTAAKVKHIRETDAAIPEETLRKWLLRYEDFVRDWNQPWLHELVNTRELARNPAQQWSINDSLKLLWIASVQFAHEVLMAHPSYGNPPQKQPQNSRIEELINPYLIKFTSTFLDTGLAHLGPVDRTHGLLEAFLAHMETPSIGRPKWAKGSVKRFLGLSPEQVITCLVEEKGIVASNLQEFILSKALVLKGWAGLVHQSELGVAGITARASVAEFLAVRLILESMAEAYFSVRPDTAQDNDAEMPFDVNQPGVADLQDQEARIRTTAYHFFHAFQLFPCSGSELLSLPEEDRRELVRILSEFNLSVRCRVWHRAYEWNLYARAAASLLHHNNKSEERLQEAPLKCQLVCCIDDREESFRRYIEEINPHYETFGTAGFFGVDAEFHSLYERPAPFCPVNVVPTHHIEIRPKEGSEQRVHGLQKLHTLYSDIDMFIESKSRSVVRGWLLALGGLLALFPLSVSILFPRWTHRFSVFLKRVLINPTDESAIIFAQEEGVEGEGLFTLDEMAHRVKMLLVSTGLSKRLAPLVFIMGHGSYSTNNPFRSAYDCGACGGRPGRMNPRVFAMMANRKDVRAKVKELGISIPDTTLFVGAFHNTCTDEVEYFDVGNLSAEQRTLFEEFKADVEIARAQNALERCRRFDDSNVKTVQEAIAHVESRAHHIAQPRPEYGHATNAMCFVGRRAITKGLFLDRRAFLVSYDKEVDSDCAVLRNLLRAVVPVCMGINLEYFFSALDNQKYGAGTKLPHNVTSLLGLMTGYCSDLRTGLPAQMVEIHEPVRLMLVVEQSPEALMSLFETEPELLKVIKNHWVTLMAYSSENNKLFYIDDSGRFAEFVSEAGKPPVANSSLSWVIGKRDHLEFARIR
jgi:uncharacterized protein YbcC (UPF0753/DUF2309 family)